MKHTPLTILTVISLTLVGCGSTEAEEEQPQSAEEAQQQYADELEAGEHNMPAGQFEATAITGGHIVFELPADPTHEAVQDLETYREATGNEPVTYLVADVDNRDGTDSINMYAVKAYDPDGNEYEFTKATNYLDENNAKADWSGDEPTYALPNGESLAKDEYFELSNQESELHDTLISSVSAAGRDTMVLVYEGDDLPDEYTRVAVWPNGAGDQVEAHPTE